MGDASNVETTDDYWGRDGLAPMDHFHNGSKDAI